MAVKGPLPAIIREGVGQPQGEPKSNSARCGIWLGMGLTLLVFAWPAASAEQVIRYTNRVETFSNTTGRVFTGVRLDSASKSGLIWWATNSGTAGGRVPLAELSPETRSMFGIPDTMVQAGPQDSGDKVDRYFRRLVAAQNAKKAEDMAGAKAAVDKLIGRDNLVHKFSWSGEVGTAHVGLQWSLLTVDEKRVVGAAFLSYARSESPSVDLVVFRDGYSDVKVATMSTRTGFTQFPK